MLTKITIRNFKLFKEVEIPLGNGFVFVGPNNSGKTSALQALTLWHAGLHEWARKHAQKDSGEMPKRSGVTVNRLSLIPLPVSKMDLIWLNTKVRQGGNQNIRIGLIVEGISGGKKWTCGLEFDYANQDSVFCRPLQAGKGENAKRMPVPKQALDIKISFLPPMSGLATEEALVQEGRINVLTGQGQTAEVLRNLCYRVYDHDPQNWKVLVSHIQTLFGVTLNDPEYLESRGAITMNYVAQDRTTVLDLPSSGRGMHQVLLLLAHLYDNTANTVFLLDEPDAHLEILRQRQIYNLITEVAERTNSQIISASHSEVLLGEAASRESAVAFIGRPHVLGANKQGRVLSALKDIGFEYYYTAEQKGWILYLEGTSDLSILQSFAKRLKHPAEKLLQDPLVKYLQTNVPADARRHFHALREAKTNLVGILLIDRAEKTLQDERGLSEMMWRQREIENYLCSRTALMEYATSGLPDDIFGSAEKSTRHQAMETAIVKLTDAAHTLDRPKPFSADIKASDDFLVPLFKNFCSSVAPAMSADASLPLQKKDFYKLVDYLPLQEIDAEVKEKLDAIVAVAERAQPGTE